MVIKFKGINSQQEKLLNEAGSRMRGPFAFEKLWHQLDAKHQALFDSDINVAYVQCGRDIVTLWLRIHGGTYPEALLSVAHELGFLTERVFIGMSAVICSEIKSTRVIRQNRPSFNRHLGELSVDKKPVLKVRNGNRESGSWVILSEFQECRWPNSIKNPLRNFNSDLTAVIRNLNIRQKAIRFKHLKSTNEISWFLKQPSLA